MVATTNTLDEETNLLLRGDDDLDKTRGGWAQRTSNVVKALAVYSVLVVAGSLAGGHSWFTDLKQQLNLQPIVSQLGDGIPPATTTVVAACQLSEGQQEAFREAVTSWLKADGVRDVLLVNWGSKAGSD